MKKVALLFSALALVLGLSQCKKVRPDMPHYSGPVGDMYIQHVTVGASYGNSNSKVSAETPIGKALKLNWDENDKLDVYNSTTKAIINTGETALTLDGVGGSPSGKFNGTITTQSGSYLRFFYRNDNTIEAETGKISVNFMEQTGTIEDVMGRLALQSKEDVQFKGEGVGADKYSAEMIAPFAILKLDLSKLGTTGDGSTVTVNDGTNDIATILNVKDTSTEMYVALPTDNLYNDKNPEEVTYTFTNDSKKSVDMKWKIQQNFFYTAKDTDGDPIEVKPEPQLLPNYVCFEAVQAGSTINLTSSFGVPSDISYSTDGNNWTPFAEAVTLANGGDKCYLKTNTPRDNLYVSLSFMPSYTAPSNFECTGNIKVSGNIMALLNSENPATAMTEDNAGCFQQLFQNCKAIIDASELVLPATTLAASCYASMFSGCTNLTAAPNLPATTLAASCYSYMFNGCTKLDKVPTISATTVAANCCNSMFQNCTSLTDESGNILPATTLEEYCYSSMFSGCTGLTKAPTISATTLAANSCDQMFSGCTSLEDASNISLTATTLADNCFYSMFVGCSELKKAPELSATTAAFQCCDQMFSDCSKLEDVSKITFAETVAEECYQNMFKGCESLESVPELPAVNLETNCYHLMFSGCAKLSSVTMKATVINATGCLSDWLQEAGTDGSVSSHTVYVASGMVDDVKATVPDNWKSGVQVKP